MIGTLPCQPAHGQIDHTQGRILPMPNLFTIDERVRWSAVDKAGIIFYGAYVRFFELAEMELFRQAGVPYSEVFDRCL